MHRFFFIFISVILFQVYALQAQSNTDSLTVLGDRMLGLSGGDTIKKAFDDFSYAFIQDLNKPNSFSNKYENLKVGSFLYPKDSSFRIITWQAQLADEKCLYNGVFQTKDALIPFQKRDNVITNPNFTKTKLLPSTWYGCIYYNMFAFKRAKKEYYVLFGFQQVNHILKRKIMDVLSFENGKPVFGEPVFCSELNKDDCKNRLVLEYVADAKVRLNYDDEYKKIIYDHLIKTASPTMSDQAVNTPDGSYEAYELKNGYWKHIDMLWHDIQDVAPSDAKKDKTKRDLFGK
jgi:hypothetical protein